MTNVKETYNKKIKRDLYYVTVEKLKKWENIGRIDI